MTTPYFTINQIGTIYNFPSSLRDPSTDVVVGVVSFGGGLVGTLASNTQPSILNLSDNKSDIQAQLLSQGISPSQFPTVIVVPIQGAINSPNPNDSATVENTIDVQMIGGLCPTSHLTILLYIAPNTFESFSTILTVASSPLTLNGTTIPAPSIISCSWGAPELYFSSFASSINTQLQSLANRGVVFTAATGDNGSSDGAPGLNVDFPSSSPYAIACGGTSLVCPTYVYDGSTVETTWSGGGGGVSVVFSKPSYQTGFTSTTGRSTPDVSLVADPNTGVFFTIGGQQQVIGGTSIVSPAIAAYAAILQSNQFLTPLLYTAPASNFHDILSGSNGAYSATTGYDTTTGLGSIVGMQLANSLQQNPAVPVTGISLPASVSVDIGTPTTLAATFQPTTATNKSILWSSTNTAVATVARGVVRPLTTGTTIITAATINGGFQATCAVSVSIIPVASVSLSPSTASISPGQTTTLTATVLPTNASNKTVQFTSSNTSVATVSNTGVALGRANGTATITARTTNGQTATSIITVASPLSRITLSPASLAMTVNTTSQTTVAFTPSSAVTTVNTWTSSNVAVATVDSTGLVRAIGNGSATITATVAGKSATRSVMVTTPTTGISVNPTSVSIAVRASTTLSAMVAPPTASNKSVSWSSQNSAIATVNSVGRVTGMRAGTTTIRATSGGSTATVSVRVL